MCVQWDRLKNADAPSMSSSGEYEDCSSGLLGNLNEIGAGQPLILPLAFEMAALGQMQSFQ